MLRLVLRSVHFRLCNGNTIRSHTYKESNAHCSLHSHYTSVSLKPFTEQFQYLTNIFTTKVAQLWTNVESENNVVWNPLKHLQHRANSRP